MLFAFDEGFQRALHAQKRNEKKSSVRSKKKRNLMGV